jgi:hypothetical protein
MDQKSKQVIEDVIEDLLKLRTELFEKKADELIELDWLQSTFMGMKPKGKWSILEETKKELNPFDDEDPFIDNKPEIKEDNQNELWDEYVTAFDIPLVKLNNLLKVEDRKSEILKIEAKMSKIQHKKLINVKEFTELYGFSSDWQKNRRGRLNDHLPYNQNMVNGKITYNIDEVEIWFENNHKGRSK